MLVYSCVLQIVSIDNYFARVKCLLTRLSVVFGMLITHWLTMRSVEYDMDSSRRRSASSISYSDESAVRVPFREPPMGLPTNPGMDPIASAPGKPVPVSNGILERVSDAIHFTLQ